MKSKTRSLISSVSLLDCGTRVLSIRTKSAAVSHLRYQRGLAIQDNEGVSANKRGRGVFVGCRFEASLVENVVKWRLRSQI